MKHSLAELIIYWIVKGFGIFIRFLPDHAALAVGRGIGTLAYYFNRKHRLIVHSNLKTAFAKTKTPAEIKRIAKETFQNFGQNLIELFRLPIMNEKRIAQLIELEGKEDVQETLKRGKGLVVLAMHFGSWEMSNLLSGMLGHPYKVLVKPQKKHSLLDDLLNSYRRAGGSVVVERGMGTRDFIKSLKDNEIVALVADQGGRDGVLVPFFGREASMSVGAIKLGLKMDAPICFSVIHRIKGPRHKMLIQKPLELIKTGDLDADIVTNLKRIVVLMEEYINRYPSEYMWFYKIWKYSKESTIAILTDGKAGHLRQSEAVAGHLQNLLQERGVTAKLPILEVKYRNKFWSKVFAFFCVPANLLGPRGRLALMHLCLTPWSFEQVMSVNPEFIVSCGSGTAPVNLILSNEHEAKSITILKPSLLSFKHFDMVFLPQHDKNIFSRESENVIFTQAAPNLIRDPYLQEQREALLKRFSHLKTGDNFKIGVLLGGDTEDFVLSEQKVRLLLHQIVEAAEEMRADILLTTSRRTSARVENLLLRELKKQERCKFLVIANKENVPESVGGILGLADLVIVSSDSISMISEAACSGKKIIAFPVESKNEEPFHKTKHGRFMDRLVSEGFILSSDVMNVKEAIYKLIKNKVQTRRLNDAEVIREGLGKII